MPLATAATKLREVLADPNGFVIAPGVYDGLSARLALAAGFDALYMVSLSPPPNRNQPLKQTIRPAREPQPPSTAKQTWASAP